MIVEPTSNASARRLRLLAIIPSGFCYGLQNATLAFFDHFSPAIQPHFLITRWSDGEFAAKLDALHIPYTYSWLGMFSRNLDRRNLVMSLECLYRAPALYRDFLRLCDDFKPDLLYLANHHELLLLRPVIRRIGIPVVCHMHDPAPAIGFQRFSFRLYSGAVDRFVTVSGNVAERLRRLGPIPAQKISIVHNGITVPGEGWEDAPKMRLRESFGWPPDAVVVGMTGQMTAAKGCIDLVTAAMMLKETDPAIHVVISGKLNGSYFDEVERFVRENGLSQTVGFSPWREDVDDFYRGIDIFALPSRHHEGFGLVVAEAMARRLPIVATKSGGVVELVTDGETGYLVDREVPQQLADRLQRLIRDPQLRQRMGRAGRRRIEERFDIVQQSKELEKVLLAAAESRMPAFVLDARPIEPN